MSLANNLDRPDTMLHLAKHTNTCKATFNSKALWEGIIDEVTVSLFPIHDFGPEAHHHLAIYRTLPKCQHLWTYHPRLASPAHQGCIQGSPHWVGEWIPWTWTWESESRFNFGWNWSTVSAPSMASLNCTSLTCEKHLIGSTILWPSPFQARLEFPAMDQKQFKGTYERFLQLSHLPANHWCLLYPQVWMSAIEGFIPHDVVRCFYTYLDFCYITHMSVFTQSTLNQLNNTLEHFHKYCAIFQQPGIWEPTPSGLSLPHQHAMVHYQQHIKNFGTPNGLCSSITESKHIIAIKQPWW